MACQIGTYTQYHLVYETSYEGFEIRVLRVSPSKFILISYRELYSGIENPRFNYGDLENV